jgi:hypothetical protein
VPKAIVAACDIDPFETHINMSPNDNTTAVDVRIRPRKRAIASPFGLTTRILAAEA